MELVAVYGRSCIYALRLSLQMFSFCLRRLCAPLLVHALSLSLFVCACSFASTLGSLYYVLTYTLLCVYVCLYIPPTQHMFAFIIISLFVSSRLFYKQLFFFVFCFIYFSAQLLCCLTHTLKHTCIRTYELVSAH